MAGESGRSQGLVVPLADPIVCTVGSDLEALIRSAINLPAASHFVGYGHETLRKWFHPAARTREAPVVDVEALGHRSGYRDAIVACKLDLVARESVARFLIKSTNKACSVSPNWPGAVLWHWWLCSDDDMLIWFDDWPWHVYVDRRLSSGVDSMLDAGLLLRREE